MNVFSEMGCPECFGRGSVTGLCRECPYEQSCRFAFQDSVRTKNEDAKWENACEFYDNYAPQTQGILPVDITEERPYTHDEVVSLAAFLLRIGKDRKLGRILKAKLSGAKSFAEIARREGVTRQAIHKRVGKELAKLLGFKKRRLTDSRLLDLETREFALLKLLRGGCSDDEILYEMNLQRSELRNLKERLEWKLSRFT